MNGAGAAWKYASIPNEESSSRNVSLAPRYLAAARLARDGNDNAAIARALDIGVQTVKLYLHEVYELTGLARTAHPRVTLAIWLRDWEAANPDR